MLELYKPKMEDLWFKETMLADEETMSYNRAWGGTIAFPQEKWAAWYDRWMAEPNGERFYRYIKEDDHFLGEVAYHFDTDRRLYLADVLIYAPYRGMGYGRIGLQLLCEADAGRGIERVYDDIAIDNPSVALFIRCGFREVLRTAEYILVEKDLRT